MISYISPHDKDATVKKVKANKADKKCPCRREKRQRRSEKTSRDSTTKGQERVTAPQPPPPHANLLDILDEDLVLSNTPIGFHCSKRVRPVASAREGRGRTNILDQMDGLVKEEGDDTFMTSLSYPRGVHILPRGNRRGSSSNSAIDLVLAEESFHYWKEEIENPEPLFSSSEQP